MHISWNFFPLFSFMGLLFLELPEMCYSDTKVISMDNTFCDVSSYRVSVSDSYELNWEGQQVQQCKIAFLTKRSNDDKDNEDKYKLCVEFTSYNVSECGFEINLYEKYAISPSKNYSCSTTIPSTHCAAVGAALQVEFQTSNTSDSSVEMRLTCTKTYKHKKDVVSAVVWSVIGSLCILFVIVSTIVFIVLVRRSKKSPVIMKKPSTGDTSVNGPSSKYSVAYTNKGFQAKEKVKPPSFSIGSGYPIPYY